MRNKKIYLLFLILLLAFITSCDNKEEKNEETQKKTKFSSTFEEIKEETQKETTEETEEITEEKQEMTEVKEETQEKTQEETTVEATEETQEEPIKDEIIEITKEEPQTTKEPEKTKEKVEEKVVEVKQEIVNVKVENKVDNIEIKEEKTPEVINKVSSRLFNLATGETLDNGTGVYVGNMNDIDIYVTSEYYSCYLDNDIDMSNVDLTGMARLDQKEWNNYSYDMKVIYLNQVKNVARKMLGIGDIEIKFVSSSELRNLENSGVVTNIDGIYENGIVYINKNSIGKLDIINTLLHELRHRWQDEMFWEYQVFDSMMYFNPDFNKDRYHHVLGNYIDIKSNTTLWNKCRDMYYSSKTRAIYSSYDEYYNAIHEVDARKFAGMVDELFF